MDPEWVAACNHALDTFRSDPSVVAKLGASELWQESDCSPKLLPAEWDEEAGGPLLEERMTGLEALPKPHCDHFRKMVRTVPYAYLKLTGGSYMLSLICIRWPIRLS